MRLLLGVLFLLCCTGAPSEYHRGTFRPPPPAPVRPGVGAPVVGQPGAPANYPRSPHARVLPPAREPGVWAADKPRRDLSAPPPVLTLLGFVVPLPPEVVNVAGALPTEACVGAIENDMASGDMAIAARAWRLPPPLRECVAAVALARCLRWIEREYATRTGTHEPMISRAAQRAEEWSLAVCPETMGPDDEVGKILDAIDRGKQKGSPKWRQ